MGGCNFKQVAWVKVTEEVTSEAGEGTKSLQMSG